MHKIKELRLSLGLTQKEFGSKISIDAHNIGDWERAKCEPSIDWLCKISDTFDVSVDYLLGREDDFGVKQFNETQSATLTSDEKRLLEAFNRLNDLEKEKLIDDAEFYANRHVRTHERSSIKK